MRAPTSSGMSGTPICSKCASSAGVTMPPSHGPQPIDAHHEAAPRRARSAAATLLSTSLAIA